MTTDADHELAELRALEKRFRQRLETSPDFIKWQVVTDAIRRFENLDSERHAMIERAASVADGIVDRILKKKTHIEYAVEALAAANRPLSTAKLKSEMEKLGFQMRGKVKSLTERFSKSKKLQQVEWDGAKGWWPVDRQPPPEPQTIYPKSITAGAATND